MFSNRISYTQSPGGIRRGMIWQSSNTGTSKVDQRWHLFTPFRQSGALLSYYYAQNHDFQLFTDGYPVEEGSSSMGLLGHMLHFHSPIEINCPYFTYMTEVEPDAFGNPYYKTFGDQKCFYEDIDFKINPQMCNVGEPNSDAVLNFDSEYNAYTVGGDGNHYQITSAPVAYSKGYSTSSVGECQDNYTSDGTYKTLNAERISYPSCTMRIKARVVYADYPFALSANFTGGHAAALAMELPYDDITAWFKNYLDQYTIASDTEFKGATTSSKDHDSVYYQDFAMPSLTRDNNIRDERSTNASDSHKWFRYTEGCVYNGPHKDFQMYITPLLYPAVSRIQASGSSANDYTLYLPNIASDINPNLMAKHANPYIIPPEIICPELNYIQYGAGPSATPHYHNRHYRFVAGNIRNNLQTTAPLYTSFRGNNYIRDSLLGARGVTISNLTSVAPQPNTITFLNPYGRTSGRDTFSGACVQPKIVKGTKYTQPFEVIVAKADTTENGQGALSGRFKLIGIKGKISFFEN